MALIDFNRPSGEHGQAAVEYVGLVALVALALAALAVLVPRPAKKMLWVAERAICTGLGRGCDIGGEESLALAPCPVRRSTTDDDVHATVVSVRAGGGRMALLEERSDGSATVMIADRGEVGAEGGLGAGVAGGGHGHGARAEAGAGLEVTAGHGYRFADMEEALRFVREHRSSVTAAAASWCTLCRLAGGPPDPPDPDFTYLQGGAVARAGAEAGAGRARAGATAEGSVAEGRRIDHRTGDVTTYHRVIGEAAAELGGPVAGRAAADEDALLEYTTAADGTPLELMLRSAGPGGRAGPAVAGGPRGGAGGAALGGSRSRGDTVESVITLDLSDPRDRRAATRFVETISAPADPFALPARTRAVKRRLAAAGEVEIRSFSTVTEESGLSGHAALGLKLGGGVARRVTERTLTSAHTSPAGATLFLDRTDCVG